MPRPPKYSVLCFGDSNTWGFVPGSGARYSLDVRWAGVLRRQLEPEYWVIEEGLNGRTTVWDDPEVAGRNGQLYLPPCLQTHRPLDAVVLFLGLNDLKIKFGATPESIADGVSTLLGIIRQSGSGGLALPANTRDVTTANRKAYRLCRPVRRCAGQLRTIGGMPGSRGEQDGCEFLDTAVLISTSDIDGIHLEESAHRTLGLAVAQRIREMISVRG